MAAFDPIPGRGSMSDHLVDEVTRASRKMGLSPPEDRAGRLALPGVEASDLPIAGVRVLLSIEGHPVNYRVPTVEAVETEASELAALVHPGTGSVEVPARALERWLCQLYPPAIMDSVAGTTPTVGGTLELRAAGSLEGKRFAILGGEVDFRMKHAPRPGQRSPARATTDYSGRVELVLVYDQESDEVRWLRGTFEGVYPMHDVQGRRRPMSLEMKAVFESLPR